MSLSKTPADNTDTVSQNKEKKKRGKRKTTTTTKQKTRRRRSASHDDTVIYHSSRILSECLEKPLITDAEAGDLLLEDRKRLAAKAESNSKAACVCVETVVTAE